MTNKYLKIKSIKKIGKRETFDISVDDIHNFVLSNGILSHNSQEVSIICRLTSEADREEACRTLLRSGSMTANQANNLSNLEKGQCYFCQFDSKARLRYFFLPRTMFWKSVYPTFFELWNKLDGNWLNVKNLLNDMQEEYERIEGSYKEKEKIAKEHKEEMKKLEELRKEKESLEKYARIEEEKARARKIAREKNQVKKYKKNNKKSYNEDEDLEEDSEETENTDSSEDDNELLEHEIKLDNKIKENKKTKGGKGVIEDDYSDLIW